MIVTNVAKEVNRLLKGISATKIAKVPLIILKLSKSIIKNYQIGAIKSLFTPSNIANEKCRHELIFYLLFLWADASDFKKVPGEAEDNDVQKILF